MGHMACKKVLHRIMEHAICKKVLPSRVNFRKKERAKSYSKVCLLYYGTVIRELTFQRGMMEDNLRST